jgi:hydrogenase maturation protease
MVNVVRASQGAFILVAGLGNPILGDDGVGWRVAERVRARLDDPAVVVECLSLGGLSLMEQLIGYERAIIIDALHNVAGAVGEVTCFPLAALPDLAGGHTTAAHDTSLQTALRVGEAMGAALPAEITVVGIKAERVYDFSDTLSPAVAAAVPKAANLVLELLAASVNNSTIQQFNR